MLLNSKRKSTIYFFKNDIKTFLVFMLFFFSINSYAQSDDEKTVAFVDQEKLLDEYSEFMQAKTELRKWEAEKKEELAKKEEEFVKLKKELIKIEVVASNERYKLKKDAIDQKELEIYRFKDNIWGKNGLYYKENKNLLKPLYKAIKTAISQIAEEEKYDFIFDSKAVGIIPFNKDYDITNVIIEKLNK